ncbi:MAG: hypothetical protein CUN52_06305 [Phototrophicales bacterium]|jgi:hypothetical protein|nr:MAG: hypothetical protein CUN52_06305 [Phototrophicales bacterium]
MPIHNMNFEGGVFFAKQVGYVDDVDARMWMNALKKYASANNTPIVALVDMREVDRLCPTVLRVFNSLQGMDNVMGVALIASEQMNSRNAQVMSKLSAISGLRVFSTLDEGRSFARMRLNPTVGGYTTATAYSFAFAMG